MTKDPVNEAHRRLHEDSLVDDRESRIRAIVETVVDGIVTIDEKGIIETFNPAAERIFGYTLSEVVGRNVKMLMPAPYQGEHDGYLNSYITSGDARVIGIGRQVEGLRKNGSTFSMELAVSEMIVGKQRMFTGIVRDISEGKLAADTLLAVIAAVQNSQLVTEFEMDGTIITANNLFCDALDYRLEEIQGKHHSMFLSNEDADSADYAEFWNALKRGEFRAAEFKRIGKGGKEVWIQATYTPILNPNGTPLKVIKFATDVSNTVAYLNRIKDSEARTRAIVDTVVDGIVTIDAKGTIETFNPAAATLFGYAREEVLGRNIKLLMPEPYHSEHDGYLQNYQVSGVAKVIGIGREVTGQRKNGSTFPMELAVSKMEVSGVQMFTGIVRDITDRKEAERAKSEFISTVSHELRTPLTSIKGSLGLIRSGAIGELPDKLRAMLDIAYNNSDRLVLLINDILDMEKINAGKMTFRMELMDIGALIDEAIEANAGYANEHGVTFVKTATEMPAQVLGDKGRLMQVLSNLMSNAAKFSPVGEQVELSLTRNDHMIRIAIKDKGPGISEEFKKVIFQKFSQADSSDTRKKGGTGLGLSISKAIVERHGGAIGFETETGKGATFFVDIPEPGAERHVRSPEIDWLEKYRILICEQEPGAAKALEEILENAGYLIRTARTATEAKHLLEMEDFDALILDLGSPDESIISLLKDIRHSPKTQDLSVIVVSTSDQNDRHEMGGSAFGIIDWIEKPIEMPLLIYRMTKALKLASGAKPRILHVEDDESILQIVSALVDESAEIVSAKTLKTAKKFLQLEVYDLVILDLILPDGDGETLLPLLNKPGHPSTPVIIFSAKDVSRRFADSIKAVLVKSQTTNDILLNSIRSAIEASDRGPSPVDVAADQ